MPYNSRVPGDEDLPDDAIEPTPSDPGTTEDRTPAEGSHRGEALGLRARLAAARFRIAGAVLLLVVLGAAFAAGVGPGDGLTGGSDDTRVLAPEPGSSEAPTETEIPDPGTSVPRVGLSYLGLCRAYQEDVVTNESAAADPAYAALADDAGGQSKVRKYCDELLGEASADASATPTAVPTAGATRPTPGATGRPATPRPTPTTGQSPTSGPTPTGSPTPTPTDPGPPDPTATPTEPGGKPTKTPRP